MSQQDFNKGKDWGPEWQQQFNRYKQRKQRGRTFFGIAIAIVGVAILLRTLNIFWFSYAFSWPIILILAGIFIGVKSGFRSIAAWILVLVGIANLIPPFNIFGHPSEDIVWPLLIIFIGIYFAVSPHRRLCRRSSSWKMNSAISEESTLNIDVVFGGRKEVVTSKDFKGGVVSVTFGGCELNLSQADFSTPSVVLDFRVSFGGIEMVVPSHWEIQNEINPSFGNVEDHRTIQTAVTSENKKTLIMRGNCSFGNIELKSY